MLIDDDVWVTVRYRLFDAQGDALEPMERELTYLQGGYGSVFPAIEQALAGHGSGYGTSVHLEPEDSFGDYDPELVRLAPRSRFPDELEVGMTFEGVPGEADEQADEDDGLIYIVTDISDEAVVLDANHPLAGMALRFDLRVVGVRAASEEEIARERALAEASGGQEDSDSLLRRPSSQSDEDFDERLVDDARGFLRAEADDEADDDEADDEAEDDEAGDAAGDDRPGPGCDAPPQRRLH